MVRQRSSENLHNIAMADHDGGRLDRDAYDFDRNNQLASELQTAAGNDLERFSHGLLHAGEYSLRKIADILGKNPSTVHRTTPTALRFLRVYFIVTLIVEWLDDCNGCILSMQSAKTVNWKQDGYFVNPPQRRQSMRNRPGREQLIRLLKRQRRLLELATDLEATNSVPYVACWEQKQANRWYVDFPLCFSDRSAAIAFAKEINVNAIFHIASSKIEIL